MDRRVYFSLFVTIMATSLGVSLVLPLLPVYAQSMGATGLQLGFIFSGFALARTLLLPLVGRLADDWGRRRFMLWGLFIYTIVSIGFSLAQNPTHLIALRLFQGVGAAMTIPIARTLVGEMAAPGTEGRVMGHFNMAFYAGLTVGPWLGGFVKDGLGINVPFFSMGALTMLGFWLVFIFIPKSEAPPASDPASPKKSYVALLRDPAVAALFLFRFGIIIGLGMNWTFMPLYGNNLLGLSGGLIGILISLNVVMTTLLQPYFGGLADRVSRSRLTVAGGLVASVSLLAVPFCDGFWPLFAVNLAMGVASGIYMPPIMAMAVDLGRASGSMSRMMSLVEMSFSIGMVFGPISAGLIKEAFGLKPLFWLGGAAGLVFTVVFILLMRISDRSKHPGTNGPTPG